MAPFLSRQQQKWGNSPAGVKALGGPAKVHEWNEATKGHKLPHRVKHKMKALREHYMLATGRLKVPEIKLKHKTMEHSIHKHTSAHDEMTVGEMHKHHAHKMHPAHPAHPMHKHYKAGTEDVRHMDGTHHKMEMKPSHEK